MSGRPTLGQFEQLVLTAILSLGDEAYGVTIHRGVETLMTPRRCQLGAVYATLDRMEDKGLVLSQLSEPTARRGGRSKRYFRLTADGEDSLKEAAETAKRVFDAVEQKWGERPWSLA
jgi:PadR family transcriptional regulator, regulatory protein PadR